jgi:iron complex outermembrane recepter protein
MCFTKGTSRRKNIAMSKISKPQLMLRRARRWIRWSFLPTAVALALAGSGPASAQQANQQGTPQTTPEEIFVTGSRIQETGFDTPTPVTAVSRDELLGMAPGALIDGMAQLPQFYASTTTANTAGFFTSPGAGSLNLRGLQTKRTLTLLNGRRFVPSTIYGGPDINLFPQSLVKTVESVTGGATAAYGTDAVSGVVNFILDTDFTGFRVDAQGGETTRNDNANRKASISGGFGLGERTHVLISGEAYSQDAVIDYKDRDWYRSWGFVRSGAPGAGSSLDNPLNLVVPNVVSTNASYDGVIIFPAASGLPRMIFNPDGTASNFVYGSPVSLAPFGSQSITNGGSGTDNNSDRPGPQDETSRDNLFFYIDHDLDNGINVFGQVMYGDAKFKATNAGGIFQAGIGSFFTIYQDNAFLPANVRQLMIDNNIPSFQFGRIGHSSDIAGDAYTLQDTDTLSVTTGFQKDLETDGFFGGFSVNGYVQYGETNVVAAQQGGIRIDRIYMAADAVDDGNGNIVCNVTKVSGMYPDCVPINLFGRGNASPEAVDWVTSFDTGIPVSVVPYLPGYPPFTYNYTSGPDKERRINLKQTVMEVSASGDVAKGWAGPISMAFGTAYRKENLDQLVRAPQGNPAADPFVFPVPGNNDALGIQGVPNQAALNSVEIQFSKVPFARGEYDVSELFTEALVPLIANRRAMKEFTFDGAARYANYSGSGGIWSYKAGLNATFTDSIRLRATQSRDVRAATLGERFDRTGGASNITDYGGTPTDPNNPNSFPAYPITIVSGGNPTVAPEQADTTTVGIVWRPQFADRIDLSVDWYNTDLTGSIESFTAQQIVTACYVQGDADQCANIDRNGPGNTISIVNQTFQNINQAKVAGVDLELAYRRSLGRGGALGLRFLSSYLDENSTTNSVGVKTDRTGETGLFSLPRWKHTAMATYAKGPFSLFVQGRYIDSGLLSATYNRVNATTGALQIDVADNHVSSAFYLDTRIGWDFSLRKGGSLQVYGNVQNLLDQDPPITPSYGAFGAAPAQTNSALFDLLGRRFVMGFEFRL